MIYLTHARLMRESERTVDQTATNGTARDRGPCRQLVADDARYLQWHARHEHRMLPVARERRRELQIVELRRAAVEQLHRAALVRYFRDSHLSSGDRDCTLRLFYGLADPRDAAVREHGAYLLAAPSQLCAMELLDLVGDTRGVELISLYELAYGQYLGLFCERARSRASRQPYLLSDLLPEVKVVAVRLRERIVRGRLIRADSRRADPPHRSRQLPSSAY